MEISALVIRGSKVLLTAGLAFFAFLATLGNLVDYDSNWAFVQHVLAMDTIFPDSVLRSRAVLDPAWQRAAYAAIIVTEGLTCLAFSLASLSMLAKLRAPNGVFVKAKSWTALGVALGFGLWFIGFMALGGEWFAMWQSAKWNGQNAAFMFYMTILAVAVYVFLDNDGGD